MNVVGCNKCTYIFYTWKKNMASQVIEWKWLFVVNMHTSFAIKYKFPCNLTKYG